RREQELLHTHGIKLQQLTDEFEAKLDHANRECEDSRTCKRQAEDTLESAKCELREVQQREFELREQLKGLEQQLDSAVEHRGRVWERPVAKVAPEFVPLAERGMPIVSVINLKGGVGKTTLTANLALL